MITYGCRLPLSNERKRFQEEIGLVQRVDEDPFGGTLGVPGGLHSIYAISVVRHARSAFKFRHRP